MFLFYKSKGFSVYIGALFSMLGLKIAISLVFCEFVLIIGDLLNPSA